MSALMGRGLELPRVCLCLSVRETAPITNGSSSTIRDNAIPVFVLWLHGKVCADTSLLAQVVFI